MSTHSGESREEKSQTRSALFLGELVITFNCGTSILGESFDSSHKYNNHEFLAFVTIEFIKHTIEFNIN